MYFDKKIKDVAHYFVHYIIWYFSLYENQLVVNRSSTELEKNKIKCIYRDPMYISQIIFRIFFVKLLP